MWWTQLDNAATYKCQELTHVLETEWLKRSSRNSRTRVVSERRFSIEKQQLIFVETEVTQKTPTSVTAVALFGKEWLFSPANQKLLCFSRASLAPTNCLNQEHTLGAWKISKTHRCQTTKVWSCFVLALVATTTQYLTQCFCLFRFKFKVKIHHVSLLHNKC